MSKKDKDKLSILNFGYPTENYNNVLKFKLRLVE